MTAPHEDLPPREGTSSVPSPPRQHVIRRTRLGGVWAGLAAGAIVLVFLLIFILENSQEVSIGYFGAHGHLPLGVALLLAAVGGALLVVIPGTARIIQLRRTARRHRHLDANRTSATSASAAPQATPGPQDSPDELHS